MEKFGIFELLDALSAVAGSAADAPPSPQEPPAEHPAERKDGEKKAFDPAFSAPDYGTRQEPVQEGASALDGFIARHEKAKSRIGK